MNDKEKLLWGIELAMKKKMAKEESVNNMLFNCGIRECVEIVRTVRENERINDSLKESEEEE